MRTTPSFSVRAYFKQQKETDTMRKLFHPPNKEYENLSEPSTRSLLSSHTVLVDGKLLSGKDLRVYAKRHGLCQICGQTKTHQRGGSILHRTWEPITATMDGRNYIVYKGYCLQPTCYTLNKAQERLGERQRKTPRPKRRRKTRKTTSATSAMISSSDLYSNTSSARTTSRRNSCDPTSQHFNSSNSTGMSSSTHSLTRFPLPSLLTPPSSHEQEQNAATHHQALVKTAMATRGTCDIVVPPNLSPAEYDMKGNDMYPDYDYTNTTTIRPVAAARLDPVQQVQAAASVDEILDILEQHAHQEQVVQVGFDALQARFISNDDVDDNNSIHVESGGGGGDEESMSPRWASVVWELLSSVDTTFTSLVTKRPNNILRYGLVTMLSICQQSHEHAEQAAVEGIPFLLKLMMAQQHQQQTNATSQYNNNDDDDSDIATEIRDACAVLLEKLLTYYTTTVATQLSTELPEHDDDCYDDNNNNEEDILQDIVELLVQQLDQPTFDVTDSDAVRLQEYRARSLFHLAECGHRHRRCRVHLAVALTDKKRIKGCRAVLLGLLLQDDILTDLGLQATLSLLAMMFSSSSSSLLQENSSNSQALGPEGLGAINSILARDDSIDTHKAAINLLHTVITHDPNVLRIRQDEDDQTSLDVVLSICEFLGHHYLQKDHEELIHLGLMVLLNVFPYLGPHHMTSDEQRRKLATTIVKGMQAAQESSRLLSVGVLLLNALLDWGEEMTNIVSEAGATDLCVKIFRRITHRDRINDEHDDDDGARLESLKLTTTVALAQLVESGCGTQSSISLLRDVQAAAQNETDSEILDALFRIIQALIPRISTSLSVYQGEQDVSDAIPLVGSIVGSILKNCEESSAETVKTLTQVATFYENLEYLGKLDQLWLFLDDEPSSCTKVVTHSQLELRAIVQFMESNRGDHDMLDACYTTLAAFFRSTSAMQDPLADPVHEDISKVLLLALDTFKNQRTNLTLQKSASPLFWALLCRYDGNVINDWTARLLECLQDANCDDPNAEPALAVACDLLGIFVSRPCATRSIGRLQLLKFFLTFMKAQRYQVVLAAGRGLASLMDSDPEASSLLINLDGIAVALVTCLERHQAAEQIQKSIFSILLSQHILENIGFRDEIANLGGFKAIATAMTAHCADSSFVLPAYRCLIALLTEVEVGIVWGLRGHICETLVQTFQTHAEDVEIQTAATDLIRSLCVKDDRFRQMLAGTGSIIPLLLSTMETHMSCPVLLSNGCTFIRMVVRYDMQHLLFHHDAVNVTVKIMLSHAGSPDVLKEALTTLTKLSSDPMIRGKIDCDRAETAVVCLIEAYAFDPEILKEAFGALNNLVVLRMMDRPIVSCMSDEVLKVLLNSVKYFLNEEALQMNASLLLKSYTYEPRHLNLLQSASDMLVPLLFDVSENYAGEIRERAQYIIHSL